MGWIVLSVVVLVHSRSSWLMPCLFNLGAFILFAK